MRHDCRCASWLGVHRANIMLRALFWRLDFAMHLQRHYLSAVDPVLDAAQQQAGIKPTFDGRTAKANTPKQNGKMQNVGVQMLLRFGCLAHASYPRSFACTWFLSKATQTLAAIQAFAS